MRWTLLVAGATLATLLTGAPVASATITFTPAFSQFAALRLNDQACIDGSCDQHPHATVVNQSSSGTNSFSDSFTLPQATAGATDVGNAQATSTGQYSSSASFAADRVTFTASGNATVSADTAPANNHQAQASAIADGESGIDFTTDKPLHYELTGSGSGPNATITLRDGPSPGFTFTDGTLVGQPSGTLEPGTYEVAAFISATVTINPSSSSGSLSDSSNGNFTVTFTTIQACGATSVQVGLALASGCFTERQDQQGHPTGVFETGKEAWVGGFDLKPRSGAKLVLDPGDHANPIRAEGGTVDWVLSPTLAVPAPLGELKPFTPSFTFGLNSSGTIGRVVALPLLQGASGEVKVTWAQGGGGATLDGQVSVEDLTKSVGDVLFTGSGANVGTVSGKLTLTFVNNQPFEVTAADLQIPEFAMEMKGSQPAIKLGFGGAKFSAKKVGTTVEWSGEGTFLFPWEGENGTNQGKITGRMFFTDTRLTGLGFAVSGFEVPIGETGWDWTGVNANVVVTPPQLAFDLGITAQEHISFGGVPVSKLTGDIKILQLATECTNGSNPIEFLGTANLPPLEVAKLGQGTLTVTMCAYLQGTRHFAFEAKAAGDVTIDAFGAKKLFTASGSASGWFSGTDFNLDGSYQLKLPVVGTIGAQGVLSSEGYAFCGTYGFITEGFATNNWLDPPSDLTGCDFTPFRAVPPHAADVAGAGRQVQIPAGQTAFELALRGGDRAPRVRVIGPDGERFTTPAGRTALKTSAAIILPVDQLKTTYVYLHNPAAGLWRIVALAGSAAIARVDTASQLPSPHVSARITRLSGGRLRVTWRATAVPGQQIRLLDRAQGLETVIQPLTASHTGAVTFKPSDPLAEGRTIQADVFQNGRQRAHLILSHYVLTLPARPARVTHLTATRTSRGLSISWHRALHAHDYQVTLKAGTKTITATDTIRTALLILHPPGRSLTIRVQPHDTLGRTGPTATLQVP